jgi:UDP-3-O-[3-hydroxymyristoyl] glucosamine N-acyltransferase
MASFRLEELARELGARLLGDPERIISGPAPLDRAGASELGFLANPLYRSQVEKSAAGAILIRPEDHAALPPGGPDRAWLLHDKPYEAFARAMELFLPPARPRDAGIHGTAVVSPEARVHPECHIGPGVVIEAGARIGRGSVLLAGCMVYENAEIGEDCLLHSGCAVREGCRLGNRVVLQNGAVIGSEGFGFAPGADGRIRKIPQTGIVVLEDDVEVGANTCIDRATMGTTLVMAGSKLDNLVQVAHNVVIGAGCMVAALTGVAGSSRLGEGCVIGGHSAVSGHLRLGKGVTVGGFSGVTASAPDKAVLAGFPAVNHGNFLAQSAAVRKLPELRRTLRQLEERLARLENRQAGEDA